MKTYRFFMGAPKTDSVNMGLPNEKFDCMSITFQMTDIKTNQSIYVIGHYGRYGNDTWGVEVTPANSNNMPNWTMRVLFKDYTAVLKVDVPDEAEILIQHIKR